MSKLIKSKYFAIALALIWISCNDDSDVKYSEGSAIQLEVADPFIQVNTGFVSFKPGTESYDISFNVVQGTKEIEAVNVYTQFKDQGTGNLSNETLIGTYPLEGPNRTVVVEELTYDELKEGLTVNEGPLPATDDLVVPGSGWTFRFEGVRPNGDTYALPGAINMVFSKYAGIYTVTDSKYFRIGVASTSWTGSERFIGHIDDITLSHPDAWGPFDDWSGSEFHFTVDPETKEIEIVLTDDGLYSGQRLMTCATDKKFFEAVGISCDDAGILIEDEATGHHVIVLAYGYMTETGAVGPRVFYERLVKK